MMMPRGIRNNNPLNIKEYAHDKTSWVGERASDDDPIFEEFETIAHGIRAAMIILKKYYHTYGLQTIRDIINRWAPPEENVTSAYVKTVSHKMGAFPDQHLEWDEHTITDLVMAMSYVENGGHYITYIPCHEAWEMLHG